MPAVSPRHDGNTLHPRYSSVPFLTLRPPKPTANYTGINRYNVMATVNQRTYTVYQSLDAVPEEGHIKVAFDCRSGQTEMRICRAGRHAASCRAHQKPLLNQKRLDHVYDGAALLAHRGRQAIDAHGSAFEFLDDREQQFPVQHVEALRIDLQHVERRQCDLAADESAGLDLGKIAHPPQQSVGDARCSSRTLRDAIRSGRLQTQLQDRRAADDGLGQLLGRIEFQP